MLFRCKAKSATAFGPIAQEDMIQLKTQFIFWLPFKEFLFPKASLPSGCRPAWLISQAVGRQFVGLSKMVLMSDYGLFPSQLCFSFQGLVLYFKKDHVSTAFLVGVLEF